MRTVLDPSDIQYLGKKGIYFFQNNQFTYGSVKNESPLRNIYDEKSGIITLNQETIFTARKLESLEKYIKYGSVKCFDISNPKVSFNEGALKIEFFEYSYDQIVHLLNREYSLNEALKII